MSQAPTHRLGGSLAGALAGGGDPATSPLYVFGPMLALIVPAGVATVTFGASIWLAVVTVVAVSAMYRLVMRWVTDGTGGTGLSEEEFGPWAAKTNAAITLVEYTLTALVSFSALVTFIADRVPAMGQVVAGVPVRTLLAIAFAIGVAAVVNRGPRVAAMVFGPATAMVLALLWIMVAATVLRHGVVLPSIHLGAFGADHIGFTLGGYARILALMTGIEVFANLVPAFTGSEAERSRSAFGSLAIVMGSTCIAMIILGPAILAHADVTRAGEVSVFTQTMDALLPGPLSVLGSLVGIVVLLSASAAAISGVQYLAQGLAKRHYVPTALTRTNKASVAPRVVWGITAVVIVCFAVLGTREETYLSVYAAGVFVLLTMTAWAATRRLVRESRGGPMGAWLTVATTAGAAALTSLATVIIFAERFTEGAWLYFLLVPGLFTAMSWAAGQSRSGEPDHALGRRLSCGCAGLAVFPAQLAAEPELARAT
ncbi:MAG TPA: APC family permease [Deltaproteobacteria bacterium]|nr:APC family permease [Deltaproteobacteria bacterium]